MWKLAAVVFGLLAFGFFIAFMTTYHQVGAWTIQDGANVATIIGNLAVAGSIFFIAAQLKKQSEQLKQQADQAKLQTQLAKAANSQSFVNISSEFVLSVGSDCKLMKFWYSFGATYEAEIDEDKKAQYRYLVQWWLNFYENVEHQNAAGLLEKDVYDAWMSDMKGFVNRRHVEKIWDAVKANYSDPFVARMQPIIDARRLEIEAAAAAPATAATTPGSPPSSGVGSGPT
jgi:hypothetical protein